MDSAVDFTYRVENSVAIISIDCIGESVNTLKDRALGQVDAILAEIATLPELRGVIIISAKPDSFIAGADVNMIAACKSREEATQLSAQGQALYSRISGFAVPVVAAIHGSCLGGGLELVLACDRRIITDSSLSFIGLPEVKLGLLPGSGGTVRLPKLIGLQRALQMMLTGMNIKPKRALAWGLVDEVVAEPILLTSAIEMVNRITTEKKPFVKRGLLSRIYSISAITHFICNQAKKQLLKKTKGHYPAPIKIIELIEQSMSLPENQAFLLESEAFGELTMTPESKALRQLFFSSTGLKKSQLQRYGESQTAEPINKVAVIGGGFMGSGICNITVTRAKLPVRLKEASAKNIHLCIQKLENIVSRLIKQHRISIVEQQKVLNLLTGTTDYSGLTASDIVLEAVFEDLALKQQMLSDIESRTDDRTIFATNTSSIPIAMIAQHAKRPENVIGLHYFSPVEKMPLVEVIPHKATSNSTIQRTLVLARMQGKTPIVVKDSAGFYVNRILAPYIKHTLQLVREGVPIELIDKAMVAFGFPVGPCRLLDEVGIDVASKISPMLAERLGERFAGDNLLELMVDHEYLGKKSAKGFYCYKAQPEKSVGLTHLSQRLLSGWKKANTQAVSVELYRLLAITHHSSMSEQEIQYRCLLPLLNEAVRCLDEGIIESSEDGDIGAVFGIGFPPFLGGPFCYIFEQGIDVIEDKMTQYAKLHGDEYLPCNGFSKVLYQPA